MRMRRLCSSGVVFRWLHGICLSCPPSFLHLLAQILSNVFSWFYFVVQDITKFLVHFRNATDQLILNLLQKGKTWWYKSEFYFLWNSQHLSKLSHFKLNSGWSHTNTVKCFRLSNFKYHFVSCSLDLNYFSSAQYLFTIRKL